MIIGIGKLASEAQRWTIIMCRLSKSTHGWSGMDKVSREFYNNWSNSVVQHQKEFFVEVQMYCSDFHQWPIHFNTPIFGSTTWPLPYSLVPDPQFFWTFWETRDYEGAQDTDKGHLEQDSEVTSVTVPGSWSGSVRASCNLKGHP